MRAKLTFYQVAARYNVVPSTLYAWVHRGWIPKYHKLGRKSWWFEDELEAWEEDGCPRTCDNLKEEVSDEQVA